MRINTIFTEGRKDGIMGLIRARTQDIKSSAFLSESQKENIKKNNEEALSGKVKLDSYPQRVVCEMTSACNIHCKMCGREAAHFKATMFNKDWLDTFEPITDRLGELTLLGWGEPTLHPQFPEFLKWAYDHKLQKFFCTNGTRLHELKDAIFQYQTELLTVSLDGADAETNNRIRCGADFDIITGNIKEIAEEKKKSGVSYPYLSIVMTMMESNFRQFPEYVRLAGRLGIQEAKGVYLTVFDPSMMDELMYDKAEELREIFGRAEAIGNELGIAVKLPYIQGEDIAGDKAHKDCYTAWRDFFLGSDGYVRSCMSTSHKLFHISKYKTFDEMWNSQEYQDFRSSVNSDGMNASCLNCYQASFANWNKKRSFVQTGMDFAPEWEKGEDRKNED